VRVLLVEDDALLGDGVRAGLKLDGYTVDWVRDGEAARLALLDHAYLACVLDLGLPKRGGLSVLQELACARESVARVDPDGARQQR
jgi:DNA-binding response OmpR family regulator